MKDRIKALRHALDLTQEQFALGIGVKRNTIATYESGRSIPISAVQNSICKAYHVNPDWLSNGSGEMFFSNRTALLKELASEYKLSNFDYILLEQFLVLSKESRDAVTAYARHVAVAMNGMPDSGELDGDEYGSADRNEGDSSEDSDDASETESASSLQTVSDSQYSLPQTTEALLSADTTVSGNGYQLSMPKPQVNTDDVDDETPSE